jgi:Ca2+-transporting ATPase
MCIYANSVECYTQCTDESTWHKLIAKEASDIIPMDDNFSSIVSTIMWGCCANDSVRRFLQFQISVNITAVLITFISSIAGTQKEFDLTAVQWLWINIIMNTFAALALATNPATPEPLKCIPDRKNAPLFSVNMGNIHNHQQSIYWVFIVLLFNTLGAKVITLFCSRSVSLTVLIFVLISN